MFFSGESKAKLTKWSFFSKAIIKFNMKGSDKFYSEFRLLLNLKFQHSFTNNFHCFNFLQFSGNLRSVHWQPVTASGIQPSALMLLVSCRESLLSLCVRACVCMRWFSNNNVKRRALLGALNKSLVAGARVTLSSLGGLESTPPSITGLINCKMENWDRSSERECIDEINGANTTKLLPRRIQWKMMWWQR